MIQFLYKLEIIPNFTLDVKPKEAPIHIPIHTEKYSSFTGFIFRILGIKKTIIIVTKKLIKVEIIKKITNEIVNAIPNTVPKIFFVFFFVSLNISIVVP
ncbi:hypothetical protein [Planktothrix serta]|uniref:hypothetical protein n=1 Tax=Planktothrix serta TaxID=1678310 RepID=UPI0012DD54D6|nr:hypothetical protein [Planktothrix serta]